MDKHQAQARITALTAQINQHNYNYYVLSRPVISDFEFDKLLEELIALEKQFPDLIDVNSPSQRVGGQITKEFKTRELVPKSSLFGCSSRTGPKVN